MENNAAPPTLYIYIPKEEFLDEYASLTLQDYWPRLKNKFGKFNWTLLTYLHLKSAGFPCELTHNLHTGGIVLTHRDFLPWDAHPHATQLLVCVKSDKSRHPFAQLHITQNPKDNLAVWWQRFLWPKLYLVNWPQPNLVPRDQRRGDRFENIAYIGSEIELAAPLKEPVWAEKVRSLGLKWTLVFDKEKYNDYSSIDALVAVRAFHTRDHYIDKVASKLRNAWRAQVPAILGPESSFRAERRNRLDYIEVNSMEEVLAALKLLKDDKALRARMIENGNLRKQELTPEIIREEWAQSFQQIVWPMYEDWCRRSGFEKAMFILLRKVSVKLHSAYIRLSGK
jgi:hypothetical protein